MKFFKHFAALVLIVTVLLLVCGCSHISDIPVKSEAPSLSQVVKDSADGNLKVHFIDIGQGDSEFIEFPDGTSMLIDAGEIGKGEIVKTYIKALGYKKINYIVASHPHSDHIGGMEEVLKNFSVDCFYMPEVAANSSCFTDTLEAVEKNGCKAEYITAEKMLVSDDTYGFSVNAVAPVREYEDLNNSSAVLHMTYKNSSFLFTGDAEKESEYDILNSGAEIRADVLKVGHHGSSTSSTDKFLNKVKPKYGIISCESGNSYGHPHRETVSAFEKRNIEFYRTDLMGTIIFETDGIEYKIYTDSAEIETESDIKKGEAYTSENIEAEVFRTKSGECYHLEGCNGLSRTKIPTTVEEAKADGLRPCPNCNPPRA